MLSFPSIVKTTKRVRVLDNCETFPLWSESMRHKCCFLGFLLLKKDESKTKRLCRAIVLTPSEFIIFYLSLISQNTYIKVKVTIFKSLVANEYTHQKTILWYLLTRCLSYLQIRQSNQTLHQSKKKMAIPNHSNNYTLQSLSL